MIDTPISVYMYLSRMQAIYGVRKIGVVLSDDKLSLVQLMPDGECIVLK